MVSVIIPVYNVEKYIKECVDSVIIQSYKNLEIILIDDGSKDESGNICDELAIKDSRIVVFHKENGGLSSARNKGIDIAHGKYIFFLDSDDVIEKNAINSMVKIIEDQKSDVVIAPCQRFINNIFTLDNILKYETVTRKEAIQRMLTFRCPGHEACGKLYKKELWTEIRFPVGKLYEDYLTTYRILVKCRAISFCNIPFYFYRVRKGSIMNTKIGDKEMSILDISQEVTDFISGAYPELSKNAEYFQLVVYLKTMHRILLENSKLYENQQRKIIQYSRKHWQYMFFRWVRKKDKIKLITLLINKRLFVFVYNLGEKRYMSGME